MWLLTRRSVLARKGSRSTHAWLRHRLPEKLPDNGKSIAQDLVSTLAEGDEMARRGLLAELQHMSKVAAREREQAHRAAVRDHDLAVRRAQAAQVQAERARLLASRASESERKRAELEARRLLVEAKETYVAALNAALAQGYDEIDNLLGATLDVDDFVDLEALRQVAAHPAFKSEFESPTPNPPRIVPPAEPLYAAPATPTGIAGLFGKKKQAEAVAEAQSAHQAALAAWHSEVEQIPIRQRKQAEAHDAAEQDRLAKLAAARESYDVECAGRQQAADESNMALDELIAGLSYGTGEAIQEYVSIVLSNSVYPDSFPVQHEFKYDPEQAELSLRVLVPGPSELPATKAYKYQKSTNETTSTELPQKQRKDRYAGAVSAVALRSIHEVFEADRRGLIKTISLELGTNTIDPAVGKPTYVPFVAVASARDRFLDIDLSAVVPSATLQHLGAVVAKNPFDLAAIDPAGVRKT